MSQHTIQNKAVRLFIVLGGFFIANALVAEFIGVKIFSLENTLGWEPFNWNLIGIKGTLSFTTGVLLWPIVFIMTDVINEYFGKRGVRFLSYLAVALISYAFLMVYLAIDTAPADWWVGINADKGVPNMQLAFANVFGQGLCIIIGSITAFLLGQIIDVLVFHRIRKMTGEGKVWLRATGSTLVSQFIDSFVVLYIAFILCPQCTSGLTPWSFNQFLAVGLVNYAYKFIVAIALTPAIYAAHSVIDNYLGEELAEKLKREAAG